jgi:hypothetical protein
VSNFCSCGNSSAVARQPKNVRSSGRLKLLARVILSKRLGPSRQQEILSD